MAEEKKKTTKKKTEYLKVIMPGGHIVLRPAEATTKDEIEMLKGKGYKVEKN